MPWTERALRVLLMEDDAGLAALCRRRLERAGHKVAHAADGEQGLAMYAAGDYDAVVLDHAMPVYDGLQVLRALRERGPLPPIVMVTGTGNERLAVDAMRLGAVDYMVKDTGGGYLDLLAAVIERAVHQHRVEERVRLAAKVFDSAAEGILVTDAQARIVSTNRAFTTITGYTLEEVAGKKPSLFHSLQGDEAFASRMWRSLDETGEWQGEVWDRRKDGEVYPVWFAISAVKDARDQITNYVGLFTDITLRKQAEEGLRFLATHDPLTRLPNREMFHERLAHALAAARRRKGSAAVMLLDLDYFKEVNDALGHAAGDLLLTAAADRLTRCVRDCDTVGRIGGDEFTAVLSDLSDARRDAEEVARRVLKALSSPLTLGTREFAVTASIGISLYPQDGDDPEVLLKRADDAMYRAKKRRNCFAFHA